MLHSILLKIVQDVALRRSAAKLLHQLQQYCFRFYSNWEKPAAEIFFNCNH